MIYHITTNELWEKNFPSKIYKHPTLETEGFIHCSTKDQFLATLNRHFQDETEVLVLDIVEKRISDILKWDKSTNDELYPHIYGGLPIHAVEDLHPWMKNEKGEWEKV